MIIARISTNCMDLSARIQLEPECYAICLLPLCVSSLKNGMLFACQANTNITRDTERRLLQLPNADL